MPTLKEQNDQLRKLKQRLAIWEALHYLADEKFISKDGRKVSGIKIQESGELVSEDEIEDVLKNIAEGPIAELQAEISTIENSEVVILGETKASA